MKTSAIVLALGLLTASYFLVAPTSDPVEGEFQAFLGRFGRNYFDAEEYAMRFQVFKDNHQFIEQVNSEGRSFTLGINKFADWTREEYLNLMTYSTPKRINPEYKELTGEEGKEVDWVKEGTVNAIQDQGSCGSCYAFSALASIEHETSFFHKNILKYSEQQIVDCSKENGNAGCQGGLMTQVFDYLSDFAACEADEYQYHASEGATCEAESCTKKDFVVEKYTLVPPNSASALRETATYSVVAVGITAGSREFQHYSSGVFDDTSCGTENNHAVAIVGYGTDDETGKAYFKIRNSWGTSWGEEGYMRISDENDTEGGICGFLQDLSHPMYRC